MSERRACRVVATDRSSVRYRRRRPDDGVLRERLRALAQERRRFGYRRLWVLLRREGHAVNRKRVYRLYRQERLMVRRRGGRKRAIGVRSPMPLPLRPNQRWSLDFVHDQITDGRRFRILAIVDDCTRECQALVADTSISGRPGRSRTRQDRCGARSTRGHRLQQRHRADLDRDPDLVGPRAGRLALHRSRQADPERVRGKLYRAAARRTTERDAVPFAGPCARGARNLALLLQHRTPTFELGLADAVGLCSEPTGFVRATGQDALAI